MTTYAADEFSEIAKAWRENSVMEADNDRLEALAAEYKTQLGHGETHEELRARLLAKAKEGKP